MKNISRPQYARIRRILELIRQGMASGQLPNARDFCEDLGVSRPTVMRDLDWLRDEENAPIEYAPSRHGYRLADRRDGSVELRLETAGWQQVVRWVLSWQPDCQVLSPKRLRLRIDEKMRQALEVGQPRS